MVSIKPTYFSYLYINISLVLCLKWTVEVKAALVFTRMMWQIGRQPCDYSGRFPAPHNQTITLACLCINYKDVILYSVDDQNLIVP